jgi:replicative DNA helicase
MVSIIVAKNVVSCTVCHSQVKSQSGDHVTSGDKRIWRNAKPTMQFIMLFKRVSWRNVPVLAAIKKSRHITKTTANLLRLIGCVLTVTRSIMQKIGSNINSIAKKMVDPSRGVATGFRDLDFMTLGLQPAEMMIIGGRPSMGKTSLLLQLAWQVDCPALIISAEMSTQAVGERLIAHVAGVSMRKIKKKKTTAAEKKLSHDALNLIRERELYISDEPRVTPDVIEGEIRALIKATGCSSPCVMIDYLQLLSMNDFYGGETAEVTALSKELKSMTRRLNVRMVVASQLNRANEQRETKEPRMSDLRGSGGIEQDADVIGLLHRPAYYRIHEDVESQDDRQAFLILCKNRNGPVGRLEYDWSKTTMTFSEKSERYKEFGE